MFAEVQERLKRCVWSTLPGETLEMSDRSYNAVFLATLFSELKTGDAEHAYSICAIIHLPIHLSPQRQSLRKESDKQHQRTCPNS